jgi:protein TonB
MTAEFAIGSTAALVSELAKCMDDLRRHWGMVNGELPPPATPAEFDLRGVFRSSDYPRDAFYGDQAGATTFLVMIDEKGAILDCLVKQTSGAASLDQMACQIIRTRARAKKPALDATGKPMKSMQTRIVQWKLE